MLPFDRRYRSRRVRWGFRDHNRGVKSCSCGVGHVVTPFGGNDTANAASSGGRWDRYSRDSRKAVAVAIAPLEHMRLETQWPSDAVEFLPRQKK